MINPHVSEVKSMQAADSGLRREPSQRRSRARVDRMLDAARKVIVELGSDGLRMADVAKRAGVSIGSLYQYFPDKSALIQTLAQHYNALGRACIAEKLAGVQTVTALRRAFGELLDLYCEMFWAEPVMRDIWSGMQADATLRQLELKESRANAALLSQAMKRVWPEQDKTEREATALLVMQLGEATLRLALSVDRREGDVLVRTYKRMVDSALTQRK